MAPSDHPRDPSLEPPKVPALINDYRAQRDAWRAQARDLARLREQVLAAADREARDIVAGARSDIRQILLKARRELLVLAAQVEAATSAPQVAEPAQQGDANDLVRLHADLHPAQEAFALARRDMHRILDEARPDLEVLAGEARVLRSSLSQSHAPVRTAPLPQPPAPSPFEPPRAAQSPRTSYSDSHRVRRSLTRFVIVFIAVGLAIVVATGWWLRRSTARSGPSPQQAIEAAAGPPIIPQPEEAPIPAPAPAEPAETPAGPSVNIEARRLAWMRVTVDGRVAAARLFEAGETQQIAGAQEVLIRAGDAGAVFVSVNGAEANALGRDGQVVTRRFVLEPSASPAGSPPPSISDLSVVPNRDQAEKAPPEPLLSTDAGQDTKPQPDVSGAYTGGAPAIVDTGPLAGAPQSAASPAIAGAPSPPRDAASTPSLYDTLVSAAERWFDAYYRQDRNAMAAVATADMSVTDERTDNERLPRGLAGIRRTLDDVNMQVFGDNALLTARMTERFDDVAGARMLMASSFVSQMWARRAGRWQLDNVRIVGAATLSRIVR